MYSKYLMAVNYSEVSSINYVSVPLISVFKALEIDNFAKFRWNEKIVFYNLVIYLIYCKGCH